MADAGAGFRHAVDVTIAEPIPSPFAGQAIPFASTPGAAPGLAQCVAVAALLGLLLRLLLILPADVFARLLAVDGSGSLGQWLTMPPADGPLSATQTGQSNRRETRAR